MTYIIKETPNGVIDSENRVFTFKNVIDTFDNLWVDGIIYTNFRIDGKVITCDIAPEYSLFGDYFSKTPINEVNTSYISKEIPAGRIDSKNREFSLKNDIVEIRNIWLDGAIYTDYTFDKKTLFLKEAPSISLFVDYIPTQSSLTIKSYVTYGDIKDEIWRLLGQKSSSINFNEKVLGNKIDSVSKDIWRGVVINLLNPAELIRAGNLAFTENEVSLTYNGDYEFPQDFDRMISLSYNGKDLDYKDGLFSYNIVHKDNKKFLTINSIPEGTELKLRYVAECPRMFYDSNPCPFPENFGLSVLATLCAGILAYELGLPQYSQLLTIGYKALREMYMYYSGDLRMIRQTIRPSSYKFRSVRLG